MKKLNNRVTWIYLCFAVPLISAVIVVNCVAMGMLYREGKRINEAGLDNYAGQLGKELLAMEEHLVAFCALESDIDNIQYLSPGAEQVMATKRVLGRMQKDALLYPMMRAEFLYMGHLDKWMIVRESGLSFEKNQQINSMVEEICLMLGSEPKGFTTGRWQPYSRDGDVFLVYIAWDDEAYMGFIISAEEFLQMPLGESGKWTIQLLRDDAVLAEKVRGGELQIRQAVGLVGSIGSTGLELRAYIMQSDLYGSLHWQKLILSILPLVVMLTLGILYYFISRRILKPIRQIVGTMERAGMGDLQIRIGTEEMLDEFAVIGNTLNETFAKIDELQIKEKDNIRERQKSNLRNLQLQINPHFLGNCLNMLYNASLCGDNELVLELTTHLRRYFRSMAQMERDFVRLEEELEFTDDFLAINKLRFPCLGYEIHVPEYLKQLQVPPSVIKSFAENAVQYSRVAREDIFIRIEAVLQETGDEPLVCVTITDNGPGFSEEILALLRAKERLCYDGRIHIGITNVRRRLEILYGSRAHLELHNCPDGGAQICVRLPLDGKEEES